MTDDSGVLSIDFIAGFTIFLLAFIWVLSMIPGLLIGLQGYTIDYDAVAYRTGVMLVEDPGEQVVAYPYYPWQSYGDQEKEKAIRFGLAVSKDTPNILLQDKVNRFFCVTTSDPAVGFVYPKDYKDRLIFGDYMFNISLLDQAQTLSVGDVKPVNTSYGYIRRVVKIKSDSNATIDKSYMDSHSFIDNLDNVSTHVFSIHINNSKLLGEITDPAYQIDPSREQMTINITNLSDLVSSGVRIQLKEIKICTMVKNPSSATCYPLTSPLSYPYVDGSNTRISSMPAIVNENISLRFNPQYFNDRISAGVGDIFIVLRFNLIDPNPPYNLVPGNKFLNNTQALPDFDNLDAETTFFNPGTGFVNPNTTPFDYNYFPENVTQPKLRDAILEVAVW